MAREDTEKEESEKVVAEVPQKSKHLLVRLNIALIDRSRAEKLTRFLLIEYVNTVDAAVQQLGHNAVDRLRQGLKRAY